MRAHVSHTYIGALKSRRPRCRVGCRAWQMEGKYVYFAALWRAVHFHLDSGKPSFSEVPPFKVLEKQQCFSKDDTLPIQPQVICY